MPVEEKFPYELAEWETIGENGMQMRILHVEEILAWIALGYTPSEISHELNAPQEVIQHTIMLIPDMMVWREKRRVGQSGHRTLPQDIGSTVKTVQLAPKPATRSLPSPIAQK